MIDTVEAKSHPQIVAELKIMSEFVIRQLIVL